MSVNLKPSPLYDQIRLSYSAANRIFSQSRSMPNFAKRLMLRLFGAAELNACHNVYGRVQGLGRLSTREGLDRARVDMIRQAVEENSAPSQEQQWNACVDTMNGELRRLRKVAEEQFD